MEETDSLRIAEPSQEDQPSPSSSCSRLNRSLIKVKRHQESPPSPQQNPKRAKKTPLSHPLQPLPMLPQELIVEILSRLPVKSLLRFRCVCKSFKALFSNPQFIKTHLKKITTLSKNNPNLHQRILITSSESRFCLKSYSICSIYYNPQTVAINLNHYPLKKKYRVDWVVGSSDGLLAVAVKQDFVVVWNPATRVFLRLPDLGFQTTSGSYTVFGFGYDSEIDDYKVVAVFCFQKKGVNGFGRYEARVKVCALRTKYWRSIEDFRYGAPCDDSGKYVNGHLCWLVMDESMWTIVSLDIAKETYEEVMQPEYREPCSDRTLGVLNGKLCVFCNYPRVRADLWIMKQYGVRESWTKVVSIPYLNDDYGSYSVPLCISDSDEVLLEFKSVLVIYDPKDGTFRYPIMNGARGNSFLDMEIYIETLVSPNIES